MNIPQPTPGDIERDELIRNRQGENPAETMRLYKASWYREYTHVKPYPVRVYRRVSADTYRVSLVHPTNRDLFDELSTAKGIMTAIFAMVLAGAIMGGIVGLCHCAGLLAGWMLKHGVQM